MCLDSRFSGNKKIPSLVFSKGMKHYVVLFGSLLKPDFTQGIFCLLLSIILPQLFPVDDVAFARVVMSRFYSPKSDIHCHGLFAFILHDLLPPLMVYSFCTTSYLNHSKTAITISNKNGWYS